jgi:N-acyl-D-amino-acid deacylase
VQEAVRRLGALPCETLGLKQRGRLEKGCFADVVVFDATNIDALATYQDPHRYSSGVRDVLVNGVAALRGGQPTGALPGRVLRP